MIKWHLVSHLNVKKGWLRCISLLNEGSKVCFSTWTIKGSVIKYLIMKTSVKVHDAWWSLLCLQFQNSQRWEVQYHEHFMKVESPRFFQRPHCVWTFNYALRLQWFSNSRMWLEKDQHWSRSWLRTNKSIAERNTGSSESIGVWVCVCGGGKEKAIPIKHFIGNHFSDGCLKMNVIICLSDWT